MAKAGGELPARHGCYVQPASECLETCVIDQHGIHAAGPQQSQKPTSTAGAPANVPSRSKAPRRIEPTTTLLTHVTPGLPTVSHTCTSGPSKPHAPSRTLARMPRPAWSQPHMDQPVQYNLVHRLDFPLRRVRVHDQHDVRGRVQHPQHPTNATMCMIPPLLIAHIKGHKATRRRLEAAA